MNTSEESLYNKILLFQQFLGKETTINKLAYLGKFPEFKKLYAIIREKNQKDSAVELVAKTLSQGIKEEKLTLKDLDDLLFITLEDSLFNSYIFHLDTSLYQSSNDNFLKTLLTSWNIPRDRKILSNINETGSSAKGFVICGYREVLDDNQNLETLRILLIDSKTIELHIKNKDTRKVIFPTILEIDLRRKLLHIRLRDVDNIANEPEEVGTMSGRINSTLDFISSLKPSIKYKKIENFRTSLYLLEEHLLKDKRDAARRKKERFQEQIVAFTEAACKEFDPPTDHEITPLSYIETGVLSIIATTLEPGKLGDVVGIRFRDTKNEVNKKYAEITIKDNDNNCISASNLYWLNLSVLQSTESIEHLKIISQLDSGTAVANLEFSLDTANIRVLQRNSYKGEMGAKPSQEKYDDLINFIMQFVRK